MKIVLDVSGTPKKGDLLVFDGKEYKPVSKDVVLNDVVILKKEVELLKTELNCVKEKVIINEKEIKKIEGKE